MSTFPLADRIAKALLYEGYALYPYRASALKNRQRWTFGAASLHSECLMVTPAPVEAYLRYLRVENDSAVECEERITVQQDGRRVTVSVNATVELHSPHVLLHAPGGEFASMTDPPAELADEARACRQSVTWPVLLAKDLMLCSPIILEDFPQIAPESPTDLFDSSEIDEILILRILTLTDDEKREARQDPRVAQLMDRVEALTQEQRMQLHGTFRPGERVLLKPLGRADVFDLALKGKTATVAEVTTLVGGERQCIVTVDEDPGEHRFYFRPEELERT